jgi:predicted  nucleic acid-binding Zn-ribbon protein
MGNEVNEEVDEEVDVATAGDQRSRGEGSEAGDAGARDAVAAVGEGRSPGDGAPEDVDRAELEGETGRSGETAAAEGPFDLLIRLQDLDTLIAQLRHRRAALPERAQLRSVEQAMDTLAARSETLVAERQRLSEQLVALEGEVDAISSRRTGIERRLLESRHAAPRDLQAMDNEVHHLAQRQAEAEDLQLAVMEDAEPVDGELARIESERARLDEAATTLGGTLAVAEAAVDAELATLTGTRVRLAGGLPEGLARQYEALRTRLGGVGAARLVGNHCDGCHLDLSSVEVERIRRLPADEVVSCEQCGRILVRTARGPSSS